MLKTDDQTRHYGASVYLSVMATELPNPVNALVSY